MRVTNSIRIRSWTFTQKMSEDVCNAANSLAHPMPTQKSLYRTSRHPKSQGKPKSCGKRCIRWLSARLTWCKCYFRKSPGSPRPSKSKKKLWATTFVANASTSSVTTSTSWQSWDRACAPQSTSQRRAPRPRAAVARSTRLKTEVETTPRKVLLHHYIVAPYNKYVKKRVQSDLIPNGSTLADTILM